MVEKVFKVRTSKSARIRLKKVYNYYKENVSIEVAKRMRNGLIEELDILQKQPQSKPLLQMKKQVIPPCRYARKWSYKIIFQVFEEQNLVSVIDFMHDREDPDKREKL